MFCSGAGAIETRDISNGAMTSEITIAHTGPEHAGEYRCLARNLYGTDELTFRLFVKGEDCLVRFYFGNCHFVTNIIKSRGRILDDVAGKPKGTAMLSLPQNLIEF